MNSDFSLSIELNEICSHQDIAAFLNLSSFGFNLVIKYGIYSAKYGIDMMSSVNDSGGIASRRFDSC